MLGAVGAVAYSVTTGRDLREEYAQLRGDIDARDFEALGNRLEQRLNELQTTLQERVNQIQGASTSNGDAGAALDNARSAASDAVDDAAKAAKNAGDAISDAASDAASELPRPRPLRPPTGGRHPSRADSVRPGNVRRIRVRRANILAQGRHGPPRTCV